LHGDARFGYADTGGSRGAIGLAPCLVSLSYLSYFKRLSIKLPALSSHVGVADSGTGSEDRVGAVQLES